VSRVLQLSSLTIFLFPTHLLFRPFVLVNMTSETDWSHDYCLYCDKQTLGGLYCSQACRLADLENAESVPVSPSAFYADSEASWGVTSSSYKIKGFSSKQSSKFQLPPPFDFDKYRASSSSTRHESPPISPRATGPSVERVQQNVAQDRPTAMLRSASNYPHTKSRGLNSSSSRSSLSSVSSTGSTQGLSEQAISQLQNYSNSFDLTRDWKRRVTYG